MVEPVGSLGQRADVTTGLDYYGARYYDPQAGQFAAADSKVDGLSPYAYVAGNPETMADPSGHVACADGHCAPTAGNGANAGCGYTCKEQAYCAGKAAQCGDIYAIWGQSDITKYLVLLGYTSIGSQFLQYILYMGNLLGSGFITMQNLGAPTNEARSSNGYIILNSNNTESDEEKAGFIIHEAVETYFNTQDGIPANTLNMDYAAEWFQGEFLYQIRGTSHYDGYTSDTRAYNSSYHDWLTNGNGQTYNSFEKPWDKNGSLDAYGVGWVEGPHDGLPRYIGDLPNPMGLQVWMLNLSGTSTFDLNTATAP